MIRSPVILLGFVMLLILSACFNVKGAESKIQVSNFGKTKDGEIVYRYVLSHKNGVEVAVITYGADLVSLKVPDRNGNAADIVLGYDSVDGYETDESFFGATIGRYGNRIAGAQFTLNGMVFHLSKNDGPNCLHGGTRGFNKRLWTGVDRSRADAQVLELSYTSREGEEGFPGALKVTVTYTLAANSNELRIDYSATTDKDTVVNLTNHSYFNLSGVATKEILDHRLLLHALEFTPVDSTLIPTGELRPVRGTPFDFTNKLPLAAGLIKTMSNSNLGRVGYDHNWVLETNNGGLQVAAEVFEPSSGRVLQVLTTEPGIQFCSGNFLDGKVRGKNGQVYGHRTGLCLETQHFPDSPNHPNFPSTVLKPGQDHRSTTILRFSTRN